jgi:hypothetical protein
MSNIDRLQKLWDATLITQFYDHPGWGIQRTAWVFRQKHDLTEEVFYLLKRTPRIWRKQAFFHINSDVYAFIAQSLKPLYKVLEPRDITDMFDVLEWLKIHPIETSIKEHDREHRNQRQTVKQSEAKNRYELSREIQLLGKGCRSNMAFFNAK